MKTLTDKHFKKIISPCEVKEHIANFVRKQCNKLTPIQQFISVSLLIILFIFLSVFSIGEAVLNIREGYQYRKHEHITPVLQTNINKRQQDHGK